MARSDGMASYRTYSAAYQTLRFPELLEQMGRIEERLVEDVTDSALSVLESAGAEIRGDVVLVRGEPYRVQLLNPPGERTLEMLMVSLASDRVVKRLEGDVGSFGLIRTVALRHPIELQAIATEILGQSCHIFRAGYIALESAFKSRFRNWRSTLFQTLYDVVDTELKVLGADAAVGRYWFSLTDLHRARFRYQFADDSISRAIDWFKLNQREDISPCAAISTLISEDALDAVFGVGTSHTQLVHQSAILLDFGNLPTLGEATDYWIAERTLYEGRPIAVLDVLTLDDVALQLNCPQEQLLSLDAALDDHTKEDLLLIFRENYKAFIKGQDKIAEALRRAKAGGTGSWIRDFTTDVIAKTISEMLPNG